MSLNWENRHRRAPLHGGLDAAIKDPDVFQFIGVLCDCVQGLNCLSRRLSLGLNLDADIIQIGVGVPVAIKMVLIEEG